MGRKYLIKSALPGIDQEHKASLEECHEDWFVFASAHKLSDLLLVKFVVLFDEDHNLAGVNGRH